MFSHQPIFSQKFFEEEKPKMELFLNQITDLEKKSIHLRIGMHK